MKLVHAYEALDGSLHHSKEDAAKSSLLHLSKTLTEHGATLALRDAAFIVENRKMIIEVLDEIDTLERAANGT